MRGLNSKKYVLRFRAVNRDIFEAIKGGKKKIETRAATIKFRNIRPGDTVILICGTERFEKIVRSAHIYKTIRALLRKYKPGEINPRVSTESELIDTYYSFSGYREKIKRFGLIALELE